jgi:hypothetical protein
MSNTDLTISPEVIFFLAVSAENELHYHDNRKHKYQHLGATKEKTPPTASVLKQAAVAALIRGYIA